MNRIRFSVLLFSLGVDCGELLCAEGLGVSLARLGGTLAGREVLLVLTLVKGEGRAGAEGLIAHGTPEKT